MDELLPFVRTAGRRHLGLAPDPASASGRRTPPDDAFFRRVRHHRLIGLLAAETFPEWKTRAYGQLLHAEKSMAAAESIYAHMSRTIPDLGLIKGPALALQAWPQPGLRSYDDLDFRCAHVPYDRLRDAFAALGYQPGLSRHAHNAHLWHFGWGVSFVHPNGPLVECNHRLFPPHFPWPSRLGIADRSQWEMLPFDHVSVAVPCPDLHLLYCCMHALWHGWDRLAWLVDIAGLLVRHPASLDQARTRAGPHGLLRKALETGCDRAASLVGPFPGVRTAGAGVSVPPQDVSGSDLPRNRLAALRQAHLRQMNGFERLRYTMRRMLTPGDPDFHWWCLPAERHAPYWFLRPIRIAFGIRR